MIELGVELTGTYDLYMVILSYIIAVAASFAAIDFAGRLVEPHGRRRWFWLIVGTLAMGTGIWTMHFVGMLALSLPVPVSYDPALTLISLLIALAASLLTLILVSRRTLGLVRLLSGGVVMGLAIAAMHYTGMAAMRLPASMIYQAHLVVLSVGIAIGASIVVLWMAYRLRNMSEAKHMPLKITAALLMGATICGMHYAGMAAVSFVYSGLSTGDMPSVLSPLGLAAVTSLSLLLVLLLLLLTSMGRGSTGFGIAARITAFSAVLILVTVGIIAYSSFNDVRQLLFSMEIKDMGEETRVRATQVRAAISTLRKDVQFLSQTPPIQGIIRARQAGGVDPVDGNSEAVWRHQFITIAKSFLDIKPGYLDVRYINAKDGKEIIHIEKRGGKIRSLERSLLQSKEHRQYFKEAKKLKDGEIHLSNINLNREYGKLMEPYQPVLRAAVPVYREGEIFGILVINMDFTMHLNLLSRAEPNSSVRYFITNSHGDMLYHPDGGMAFAFEFGQQRLIQNEFPELARFYTGSSMEGDRVIELVSDDGELALGFFRLFIDRHQSGKFIGIAYAESLAVFEERAMPVMERSVRNGQMLIVIAILLILLFSRLLSRPLLQITQAAEDFAAGKDDILLPKGAGGEIGLLSRAFDEMIAKVNDRSEALLQSEMRYRSLIEHSPDAIGVHDGSSWLYMNEAGVKMFRAGSADDIVGLNIDAIIDESDKQRFRQQTRKVIDSGIDLPLQELNCWRLDNHIIYAEYLSVTVDYDNRPSSLVIMRDITDSHEAKEKLQLAGKAIDNAREGIIMTDVEGTIVSANPACFDITGFTEEEVLGSNMRIFKSGHHNEDFYKQMWHSMLHTGQWQGEVWNRRKNGDIFPQLQTITSLSDEQGCITHFVSIFSDNSERNKAEELLEHQAHHDALTGLPNRLLFNNLLHQILAEAKRDKNQLAILLIDIDRFKMINDTLGHPIGDELLMEAAERLKSCVRESDLVARMGGDEFTLVLRNLDDISGVSGIAEKINKALENPFHIQGHECRVGASIGISMYPDDGRDAPVLISHADAAMYRVKERGRNHYRFFTPSMLDKIKARQKLEGEMKAALKHGEFQLYFQPQIDLSSGRTVAAEALLRWQRPDIGIVAPDQFLWAAEESGMILNIGEWVVREACRQAKAWQASGLNGVSVAVNVSASQLSRQNLPELVAGALAESGLEPGLLELELTESCAMSDVHQSIEVLDRLRELGTRCSIDDFGTGYSSFSYLKRLPVDCLKIDRSFVNDIPNNADDRAIASGIISMAHSLGLTVVAEGVEDRTQLEFLRNQECDLAQGYLFSKPLPPDEFLQWLINEKNGNEAAVK